ncbi:protein FAM136A-like [Zingiber officinale]|uniref:protein FAM136A-like n=1 Tax=Zingiber officinale TaxID=94328 RepID=UPI001C4C115B|nr:protein FAM136A-like [Zingiber officinale]
MEHLAAMEERLVTDRLRRKLEDVNVAAKNLLDPVQDHVNFNLQQAYFKCAYECFDRRRRQEEINNCVEHCSVPVVNANNLVETEMAKFQERLNRSLMVCQDKFEAAKFQKLKTDAANDLESCVNQAVDDNLVSLPHVVDHIKSSFSIN